MEFQQDRRIPDGVLVLNRPLLGNLPMSFKYTIRLTLREALSSLETVGSINRQTKGGNNYS